MKIEIRKAKPEDKDKFIKLVKKADRYPAYWSKPRFKGFIDNNEQIILLAQSNKKLIGFIGVMKKYTNKKVSKKINTEKFAYIAWIAILPEFRNKKIGSKLLKKAEQIAKKLGKNGIWLSCKKDIIEFYKNNNYKLKGYFIKKYKTKKFRKYYLIKKIT